MSTIRPRPVHLLLVAVFLLLGACAGGGEADDATEPVDQAASGTDSTEDDGPAAQPGADGVGDTPEPVPPSATPTPEALATADPQPIDGAGTTEGTEAFCAAAATFVELFDGPDPSTPEETQAYFETAITILDTMADVAPGEAAETVAGTRDFFVEVDQLAADVGYDVDAADEDALEELEQRYGATLDGFETAVADGCGLDL
ncbi:MAG: hypothetical protein ABGZ36_17440 [Actinomycetota bacterium]